MTDTNHRPRRLQEWAGEPPACVCGALWPCPATIASVVGVDHATVHNDSAAVVEDSTTEVTGLDGKTYQRKKPTPTPPRGTPHMPRNDPANTPRLCPSCLSALGYWLDPAGFCPRCAAVEREAGE